MTEKIVKLKIFTSLLSWSTPPFTFPRIEWNLLSGDIELWRVLDSGIPGIAKDRCFGLHLK